MRARGRGIRGRKSGRSLNLEGFGYVAASEATALLRVKGQWIPREADPHAPQLVMELDGRRVVAAALPAPPASGDTWCAAFALPLGEVTNARTRFTLRADEVTIGLPVPSSEPLRPGTRAQSTEASPASRMEALRADVEALERRNRKLQAEAARARAEADESAAAQQAVYDRLKEEHSDLMRQLADTRAANVCLDAVVIGLREGAEAMSDRIASLESELRTLRDSLLNTPNERVPHPDGPVMLRSAVADQAEAVDALARTVARVAAAGAPPSASPSRDEGPRGSTSGSVAARTMKVEIVDDACGDRNARARRDSLALQAALASEDGRGITPGSRGREGSWPSSSDEASHRRSEGAPAPAA
jgi:hypothetical protein